MKRLTLTLFLVFAQAGWSESKEASRHGTERDVTIARLPEAIPLEQPEADELIWNLFTHRPETKLFLHYSTEGWRKNYDLFASALVSKAREKGFEADSLKECLQKLLQEPVIQERDEVGYLPISAYRATRGKYEVWVVFCLWEYAMVPGKDLAPPMQIDPKTSGGRTPATPYKPGWPTVGHIRVFTYDLKTINLIGYVTCG